MKKLISGLSFTLLAFCALLASCNKNDKESNNLTDKTTQTNPQTSTQNSNNTTDPIGSNKETETHNNPDVVSISLKNELPNQIDVDDIDNELSRIVYVVEKSDGTTLEVSLSKNMLSDKDYQDLHTVGRHQISFTIDNVLKTITLNCVNSKVLLNWTINFKYDNNKTKQVVVQDGSDALAPTDVTGYIDNDVYYKFTGWSDTFSNVHQNKTINALYSASKLLDVEVAILSESEANVFAIENELVKNYNLQVKLENGTVLKTLNKNTSDTTVTSLDTGLSTVTGSYEYEFNNETHTLSVNKTFSTSVISGLTAVEPKIDQNSISNTELSVDVTDYAKNAPEGYRLKTVFLVDESTEEVVGEFAYDDENNIAYFDNLKKDTEYRLYFAYDEIQNTRSRYNFRVTEGYKFFFVGFVVRTRNNNDPMRCVRVVYDDKERGEKLLYRYYVSDGDSVPYTDHLYINPFSFTLPDIYEDYYAIGDYKEMENVTEDKKVNVYLIPKPYSTIEENQYRIVFIDDKTHYMLGTCLVEKGSPVVEPVFDKEIPADTELYHYEFAWKSYISWGADNYGIVDLENINKSQVLYTGYKTFEKYVEPKLDFNYSYNTLLIGSNFVRFDIKFNSTKALIYEDSNNKFSNADVYLTKGDLGDNDTRIELDKPQNYYSTIYGSFSNLEAGKYVLHISLLYNLNDGTGDKTKTFEIPFETSSDSKKDMTLSSPNYQAIQIDTTFKDNNYGFRIIPNSSDDELFESEKGILIYNRGQDSYYYENFQCNTTYRVYTTRFDDTSFVYYENGQLSSDGKAFRTLISSQDYSLVTTMDGVLPTSFVLKVKAQRDPGNTEYFIPLFSEEKGNIKLEVLNYENQIDIGTVIFEAFIYGYSDHMNEPYLPNPQWDNYVRMEFRYDEAYGALIPDFNFEFYRVFEAMLGHGETATDPETGETYTYYRHVSNIMIRYYYNGERYIDIINIMPINIVPNEGESYIEYYE